MKIEIDVKWAEFKKHMAGVSKAVINGQDKAMLQILSFLKSRIQEKITSNFVNRSGMLRNNWSTKVEKTPEGLTGTVGTNTKYARLQEFGGTIHAKSAGALTIPIPGTKALPPARELRAEGKTFAKNGIIYLKPTGPKGRPVPIYILKRSVQIKARPFVRPIINLYQGKIRDAFAVSIQTEIERRRK